MALIQSIFIGRFISVWSAAMSDRISTLLGWFRGRAPCRVTMRTLEMAAVGFMDSNSFCRVGSDCDSGRCEG